MTNPPLEEVEQKALIQWLRLNKYDFFSVPNENLFATLLKKYLPKKLKHLVVVIEKKLQDMGKRKGTLDLVIFLPSHILFLEMKRQPNKLKSGKLSYTNSKTSKEQIEFMEMLKKYNYTASAVAYGYEKAIKIIEGLK